ncbi:hypothetical protein PENTCL1PPCAC_6681, partial [Pristionchus entomophagus]
FSFGDSHLRWERESRAESRPRRQKRSFPSTLSSTAPSAITKKFAKSRWIEKGTLDSSRAESVLRISRRRSTISLKRSTCTQIGSMHVNRQMPECPLSTFHLYHIN